MNNNDLMNMLMGALSNPDTKDKISGLMSSLSDNSKESGESKQADIEPTPPQTSTEKLPAPKSSFDFMNADTISTLKSMLDNFNRTDDRRIVLLNSIKPYMKSGRERNIDMAVKFIQFINFASGFKNK